MATLHSAIRPNTYLLLRLPTEMLKLVEIKLNTIIDVGKLGSFPSNLLIGRPYHHTYELLEKRDGEGHMRLRIVPPAELNAKAISEEATPAESREDLEIPDDSGGAKDGYEYDLHIKKNNRLTVDDATRQTLSHAEIEELKKSAGGKEVIERILANHTGLEEKTDFSKEKYMLRKSKKYLKRFTVLPMDLGNLIDYVLIKEPPRIMELREEGLGLIGAWSHAHFTGVDGLDTAMEDGGGQKTGYGRWLVVDDTGGLVVAALAERMNLLHAPMQLEEDEQQAGLDAISNDNEDPAQGGVSLSQQSNGAIPAKEQKPNGHATKPSQPGISHRDFPTPASSNSITLLHAAVQPNVSLLKHFGYDTSNAFPPASAEDEHPLHTHLKPLSWLQLLHPEEDPTYIEPESASDEILASWKSGKRGNYYKKRRRWARCKAIVDDARQGSFEGLVVASYMDPLTIVQNTVSLIRGGGHVVIYSPTIEPLVKLVDLYSKDRRAAYIAHLAAGETPTEEDFPVDPRLLLGPSIQTSRVREWQVLPGRTHPLMTSRGGAEGFVFTARKVVPLEGGVEARGNHSGSGKRRRVEVETPAVMETEPVADAVSDAIDP
ncbi:related to translation initiation factor 3 (eIF-3) zeta subunit [Ramularia collo-cygni]|uniref:tRNA (adenine(58)-N(1))-methyltransferase non-catalytic subunit TRM6 n=1 Tax=Ramularia collo-cygni TaxID=112498 RepID=A0A2D3V865_9PEZI|nr:related to translation initiation factor 3 (eIF-3) zeta subunit [Ramularia collo-cygni]CZT21630.1 related to translation initiation factor 3 (eIF-3) zeta subunit [Ramularia collo-cygni]